MTAARSSSRVAKVDAGNGVAKKDVAGRVVEPLVPVSASSSGIAMLAQAKLSVGRVDDPAELEADQMAQKFSQWNGAGGSVEVSKGSSGGDAMRSADTGTLETGGFEVGADVQSEISSRSGRGVPLADDQRSKFEQFFGKDLSDVRVHADSDASQLSGSLGAEAFTVGNDVYFGSGRYQSGASDKLLAHELTHVVQQNSTLNRGIKEMLKAGWQKTKGLFGGKKTAPAPAAVNTASASGPGENLGRSNYHNVDNSGFVAVDGPTDAVDTASASGPGENLGRSNYHNVDNSGFVAVDGPTDAVDSVDDLDIDHSLFASGNAAGSSTDAGSEPLYPESPESGEFSFPENAYNSVPAPTGFGKRSNELRGNAPGGTSDSKGYEIPVLGPEKWKTRAGPNGAQRADLGFNPFAFTGTKNRAGGLELPTYHDESESEDAPASRNNRANRDMRNKYPIGAEYKNLKEADHKAMEEKSQGFRDRRAQEQQDLLNKAMRVRGGRARRRDSLS
jgi:hypothetical protein